MSTSVVAVYQQDRKGDWLVIEEQKPKLGWYIPAGRMEEGETVDEAAMREAEEESGLKLEPRLLLRIEKHPYWFRMSVRGKVTAGKLKTVAEQDKESIQAAYVKYDTYVSRYHIRSKDILPVMEGIEKGRYGAVALKRRKAITSSEREALVEQKMRRWKVYVLPFFLEVDGRQTRGGGGGGAQFLPIFQMHSGENEDAHNLHLSIARTAEEGVMNELNLTGGALPPLLFDAAFGRYVDGMIEADLLYFLPLTAKRVEDVRKVQKCREVRTLKDIKQEVEGMTEAQLSSRSPSDTLSSFFTSQHDKAVFISRLDEFMSSIHDDYRHVFGPFLSALTSQLDSPTSSSIAGRAEVGQRGEWHGEDDADSDRKCANSLTAAAKLWRDSVEEEALSCQRHCVSI